MNWRDPEFRRNILVLGTWRDKKKRRRLVTIAFAGLALTIFGLYWTGRPFETDPSLCGQLCHATNAQYQSWSKSSHSQVPCYYCHLDSPTQKLINPVVRMYKTAFDNYEKPLNSSSAYSQSAIPKERCLYCHAKDSRVVMGTPIPRIKSGMHGKHVAAGLQCATCHNRVAHSGAERFEPVRTWKPGFRYLDFTNMREGCWRCHSEDGKWRSAKTLSIVKGKKPSTECKACHESRWRLAPRTGRIDHRMRNSLSWRAGNRHGAQAKRDYFACLGCHDRRARPQGSQNPPDCGEACHGGIVMPHNTPASKKYDPLRTRRTDWLKEHPSAAASRGVASGGDGLSSDPSRACTMCHDRESESYNFCSDCHHREFLGAQRTVWRRKHPSVVKSSGTDRCQKCHDFDYCAACHTKV